MAMQKKKLCYILEGIQWLKMWENACFVYVYIYIYIYITV